MTDDSAMEEGRLEEIEAREKDATLGPWSYCGDSVEPPPGILAKLPRVAHEHGACTCGHVWTTPGDHPVCTVEGGKWGDHYPSIKLEGPEGGLRTKAIPTYELIEYGDIPHESRAANMKFIAHARTDVPDLVLEVRRLRAENDALKQQLQALRKANPNG